MQTNNILHINKYFTDLAAKFTKKPRPALFVAGWIFDHVNKTCSDALLESYVYRSRTISCGDENPSQPKDIGNYVTQKFDTGTF